MRIALRHGVARAVALAGALGSTSAATDRSHRRHPLRRNGSLSARVECCTADIEPPPTSPACETILLGTCSEPATWKQFASETCAKKGSTLTYVDYGGGSCGSNGETHHVKFTCCK